jgi:DNA polymerase-3 subunit beta
MPILSHVLLEARKDQLIVSATDLDLAVSSEHKEGCEVLKDGALAVSARHLYEIVRALPEQQVTLKKAHNNYLELRSGPSEFRIVGLPAEDFPALPRFEKVPFGDIDPKLLLDMVERTFFAVSTDETRYNLNGVFLELIAETRKIRMVATDGHRLAYIDRALGGEIQGLTSGVIIPRKALGELKRLLEEEDADELELAFQGNSGLVRKKGVTLSMRLIEGEFPSYRQVIPREAKVHLVLPAEPLAHALRRVAVLSTEQTRAVKLDLTPGLLRLSSSNPDLGQAHEELDVDYAGEPVQIAFNARYLLDAISVLGSKELRLSLQDPLSPARIVPTDDEDSLAVVMPMRA